MKDPMFPLPKGLQKHGRQYRARRNASEPWTYYGDDYNIACDAFRADRENEECRTTKHLMAWYLGTVAPHKLRPATLAGYQADARTLEKWIGHIPYAALTSAHLAEYRDARKVQHVKQEFGFLSGCFRAAIERGMCEHNPVTAVIKPSKRVRVRYVSDAEYIAIYNAAPHALCGHAAAMLQRAMTIALRSLQRPADVLTMSPHDIDGRTLRIHQSKTGAPLAIELIGDLARVVDTARAEESFKSFVRTVDGKPYTVRGMSGMFRKAANYAGVKDCGLEDLRGKGATDMLAEGKPIRTIQSLLGHTTEAQTWTYIKARSPAVVQPNNRAVAA